MELLAAWNVLDARSIIFGSTAFLLLYWFLRRPRNLPPGPRGWPIVGNLPQLIQSGEELQETFSKLAARYGNVVSLKLPGLSFVVLHGHNTMKEAFAKHQLSARPPLHITESLFPEGRGIVTSRDHWVEIRRFSLTVLRGLGVGKSSFEENISAEAEILAEEMKKLRGIAFDPKHLVRNAVSNIIYSVVFGKRFQYTDPDFKRLLKVTGDVLEKAGVASVFEILPVFKHLTMLPFIRSYVDVAMNFVSHLRRHLKDHDQKNEAVDPHNFIDICLQEKEQKDRQGVDFPVTKGDNLLHVVSDLFGAGTDTTSTTIRWCMLYMMAYPEVQTRIQKELDDATNRNRLPRISDKPELPYTEAVLTEVQRIQTIAPTGLPHQCSEDTTLEGYTIPKGTIIVANIWHNHSDPTVWEEPRKFSPERFLYKDGNFRTREEFIPFGIGRRMCLGEHLAKMELFVFFTHLLHHFTFKKPDDAPPLSFKGINGATWTPTKFTVCAIPRE